jgi:hypothetical protein
LCERLLPCARTGRERARRAPQWSAEERNAVDAPKSRQQQTASHGKERGYARSDGRAVEAGDEISEEVRMALTKMTKPSRNASETWLTPGSSGKD